MRCYGTTDPHTIICVRCHRSKIKCSRKGYPKPSALPKKRKKPTPAFKTPSVVESETEPQPSPSKCQHAVTASSLPHAESSRAASSRNVSQPPRALRPISDLHVPQPPLSSSPPSASVPRTIPRVNLRLPSTPSPRAPRPAHTPGHLPDLRGLFGAGPPASMIVQMPSARMLGRSSVPEIELPRLTVPVQIPDRSGAHVNTHAWYAAVRSVSYDLAGLRRVRESLQARIDEVQLLEAQARSLLAAAMNNLSSTAETQATIAESNEHIHLELGLLDAILEQVLPPPPPPSPASPSPEPENPPSRS